jgi:hypothetical protein
MTMGFVPRVVNRHRQIQRVVLVPSIVVAAVDAFFQRLSTDQFALGQNRRSQQQQYHHQECQQWMLIQ